MFRKASMLIASVALFAMFIPSVFAQVTGGRVTGSVLDPNGEAIAGANVNLRNKATGQLLSTQTTGSGAFNFPNALPGDYEITIESNGFQTVTQDVTVVLNQESAVNATLQTGGVGTTTVEVTASSEALVQTDSSQLGRSFSTRLVQNLPIFGSQNQLALLSPNVADRSGGVLGSGGSVGGTRPRGNVFTVDGVDNNDPSVTGPVAGVIQDAVGEFTLLQNNFNAEFGGGGGGQFVTVTRSGTNEFHGSLFTYVQNQKLNAASTAEEGSDPKPRFRNTRYGGTFGGPILKNRLFFFGAGERTVNATAGASESYLAPTAAGLGQIAGLPGVRPFIINLLQNNLTLASAETETQTVLGTRIPFGRVAVNVPAGFLDNSYQLNVDYNRGSTDSFRFRYNFSDFSQAQAGLGSPNFNNLVVLASRLFSTTYVRNFGASAVNDLRLSYRRFIQDFPLENPANLAFPNITVEPLALQIGPQSNLPQSGADNIYQLADNLTYIRGQHTFKFGGEFRRTLTGSNFLSRGRGDYIYSDFDTLLQDIAPANGDALRGVGNGATTLNFSTYNFFVQDDYKVSPNLTLNLGLRYEYNTVPRGVTDNIQFFRGVSVPGLNFENVEADRNNFGPRLGFAYSPEGESGIRRFLFGERGQSSIRGNFATSYNVSFQNLLLFSQPPQLQQQLDEESLLIAQPNFNFGPGFLERGGLPAVQLPFEGGPEDVRAFVGGINDTEALRASEIYSFALSYQRQLSPTTAMELRYLGTRGRHLPVQAQANAINTNESILVIPTFIGSTPTAAQLQGLPTLAQVRANVPARPFSTQGFFGGITSFEKQGNSNYDGGSISVTRRFSQGLAFTSAYTFSKTIDDSTNELFSSVVNPRRPEFFNNIRRERSLSALDATHRFVLAANYEVPRFENNFLRTVLTGFELAPIFQAQSGFPFTALSGVDSNLNGDSAPDRAIFNPNGVENTGSRVVAVNAQGQFLTSGGVVTTEIASAGVGSNLAVAYVAVNPNAQYIQAGQGSLSTTGRNTIRSNNFNRTDLTVLRNFRFGEERYNIQVGAEIFNLLNQRVRTIGGNPSGDIVNPALDERFGVGATNTAFNNVTSTEFNNYGLGIYGGRIIQLRAKFIF